jgi:tetratricopeptide (TPR) repeat protein
MVLMGVGLMSYNLLRFHNPLEFGQRYQLPMTVHQQFSPRYLWFNFRVGFLELARWSGSFPFVQDIAMPAKPMGYWQVDHAFGVLTNSPLAWLALAVPLAWRKQPAEARSNLCCFFWAVALLIGICALTLGLHDSMCLRYEVEFAAPLVFLAAVGVLALERALAGRPAWRRAARCGWGLLLAFSVAFNIFASFEMQAHYHSDFGITLVRAGRVDEAIIQYQKTLQIKPDEAEAHYRLGAALLQKGKLDEAIPHLQKALDVNPNFTEAHINFGTALLQKGRLDEAIAHFQKALQINPDIAQAHNNLGNAFLQKGRVDEAITHFQKALEIEPGAAVARYSLGVALVRNGRLEEAITQYQKALQLTPSDPTIQNSLAWLLATCPQSSLRNGGRAVELARQANGLTGGENPVVLRTLAAACAEAGRYSEAVETAQHALRLAQAQSNTALAGALESELKLYQAGSPFHSSEQPQ